MAVILHYKDGNSFTMPSAVSAQPWPSDDNFVQVIGTPSNPANVAACVPVLNLDNAEIQ